MLMRRFALLLLLAAGLAPPARAQGWQDFHAIMWQPQSAPRYRALHALGVDAGMVFGFRGAVEPAAIPGRVARLRQSGTPFYLENIATDFYAPYHRWTPEHPSVTWLFEQVRARHRADPSDPTAFFRTPSLSDPAWLARIAGRMRDNARAFARFRPLYYSLGDETGIADLSAPWDFDRSPPALAAFRRWLQGQYPSLAALNHEWGRDFGGWPAVVPPTTDAALARRDGNDAAWADFKTFMDHAFAAALRTGTDGLHQGDPGALAGIEGTQAPGPGGYDYIRLAHAVDLMEMYGAGDSVDIARSFNPDLVVLTTNGDSSARSLRALWHSMLQGGRGVVIWDGDNTFIDQAGHPSPRAQALAPVLHALHGGLGAQLIATRPAPGPVAILYSPLSQHLQWLQDRRADARPWTARDAEAEWNDDNRMRRSIRTAVQALLHLGLPPHFVSAEMLAGGLLDGPGAPRALVLPQAIALPDVAAAAIRRFAAQGGLVLADGPAGAYDGHGRRRPHPSLAGLTMAPIAGLPEALARAGIGAGFHLRHVDGSAMHDVSLRVLHTGRTRIVALERDQPATATETVELVLDAPAALHDLRGGTRLGHATGITLHLDGVSPGLVAISPSPLPGPVLHGPASARPGQALRWQIGLTAPGPHAAHALRIRVLDPAGAIVGAYSGVRVLRGGHAEWRLRLASDAATGAWRIAVTDVLSGERAEAGFVVRRE